MINKSNAGQKKHYIKTTLVQVVCDYKQKEKHSCSIIKYQNHYYKDILF